MFFKGNAANWSQSQTMAALNMASRDIPTDPTKASKFFAQRAQMFTQLAKNPHCDKKRMKARAAEDLRAARYGCWSR